MKFLFNLFVFERKARLYFSSSDFKKDNQIEEERGREKEAKREREQMDNRPAEGKEWEEKI